jgi:hypothetical protein
MVQYTGFQVRPRGRVYSYRVVASKSEPREFTLTISNRAFQDKRVPYQDGAEICYQKLQRELLTETAGGPIQSSFVISDDELDLYLETHRRTRKRSW